MSAMHDEVAYLSATEIAAAYRDRTLSPVEVIDAVLDRIDAVNPVVNAYLTVTATSAREGALAAERAFAAADPGALPPLFGVPVSVKDLEETAGVRTTYGSVSFRDHIPDTDAPIWARLKGVGAILIGKTATPEFGNGVTTESELSGITRNPWDLDRSAGGSSGGAASALAAGLGPIATGSDGGGSIRVPASYCGVVGLKPSAGRIPFNDQRQAWEAVTTTGPMARTVSDVAMVLSATHGPDPWDPYALLESGIDFTEGLDRATLSGLRIAYSPDLGRGPIAAETARVVRNLIDRIDRDNGGTVKEVDIQLPDPVDYFWSYWSPIIALEIVDDLLDGRIDDAARAKYEVIPRAERASSLDYAKTFLTARTQIHHAFARIFLDHDVLMWPTTSAPAYLHPGVHGYPTEIDGRPVADPLIENQILTEAIAHAGYPAISIPAGFTADGLPVGLQIAAGHGKDALVLKAAAAVEAAYPWAQHRPMI